MIFSRREMFSGGGAACMELLAAAPAPKEAYSPHMTATWALELEIALSTGGVSKVTQPFEVSIIPASVDAVEVLALQDIVFPKVGPVGSRLVGVYVLGPMGRERLNFTRSKNLKGGSVTVGKGMVLLRDVSGASRKPSPGPNPKSAQGIVKGIADALLPRGA